MMSSKPNSCKYRRQLTILSDEEGDKKYRKTDADLIMTASALGFCKILLDANHPVEITASTKNITSLTKVVNKINRMLGKDATSGVSVTPKEDFDEGNRHHWEENVWNVITGASHDSEESAFHASFESRDKTPTQEPKGESTKVTVYHKDPENITREDPTKRAKTALEYITDLLRKQRPKAEARDILNAEAKDILYGEDLGYQGRGAYTGFVVYPDESKVSMMSTKEVDVEPPNRWIPTEQCTCEGKGGTWGRLKTKWHPVIRDRIREASERRLEHATHLKAVERLEETGCPEEAERLREEWRVGAATRLEEMRDLEKEWRKGNVRRGDANTIAIRRPHLVGYVHGMIQAIYICEADGRKTAVPFEIAVGTKTTKLASCFSCTLFMYAAGYPPSAIHMDSGLSWVPYEHDPKGLWENRKLVAPKNLTSPDGSIELWEKPQKDKDDKGKTMDDAIKDTNEKWHKFCKRILNLGVSVLIEKKEFVLRDVTKADREGEDLFGDSDWWHTTRLPILQSYCKILDENEAGYLLLDAVTMHDKDANRIDRTIAR